MDHKVKLNFVLDDVLLTTFVLNTHSGGVSFYEEGNRASLDGLDYMHHNSRNALFKRVEKLRARKNLGDMGFADQLGIPRSRWVCLKNGSQGTTYDDYVTMREWLRKERVERPALTTVRTILLKYLKHSSSHAGSLLDAVLISLHSYPGFNINTPLLELDSIEPECNLHFRVNNTDEVKQRDEFKISESLRVTFTSKGSDVSWKLKAGAHEVSSGEGTDFGLKCEVGESIVTYDVVKRIALMDNEELTNIKDIDKELTQ